METATADPVSCCAPLAASVLTVEEAAATAALFAALGNPARVRLVKLLAGSDEPVCLCNLVEPLGLAQATVSEHLKRLVNAGLVLRPRGVLKEHRPRRPGRVPVLPRRIRVIARPHEQSTLHPSNRRPGRRQQRIRDRGRLVLQVPSTVMRSGLVQSAERPPGTRRAEQRPT